VATEHHFTDYPELSTLGKWLETEGNHWSCLSLAAPNTFIANVHQITGWQDIAVFEANH
jgi:hypothetical protein